MNFCWTTLHVSNMEQSLNFYHNLLGLPISSIHDNPHGQVVMLGEGDTKLELLCVNGEKEVVVNNYVSVGFTVESLDKTRDYLVENGIEIIRGPVSPNPHLQFMFIKDPDGCEVQLVENL